MGHAKISRLGRLTPGGRSDLKRFGRFSGPLKINYRFLFLEGTGRQDGGPEKAELWADSQAN